MYLILLKLKTLTEVPINWTKACCCNVTILQVFHMRPKSLLPVTMRRTFRDSLESAQYHFLLQAVYTSRMHPSLSTESTSMAAPGMYWGTTPMLGHLPFPVPVYHHAGRVYPKTHMSWSRTVHLLVWQISAATNTCWMCHGIVSCVRIVTKSSGTSAVLLSWMKFCIASGKLTLLFTVMFRDAIKINSKE